MEVAIILPKTFENQNKLVIIKLIVAMLCRE